jgi:hypothetical protein
MSFITRNKRSLIVLVLALFFFLCGAFMANLNLILTAGLFILTPALLLISVPFLRWLGGKVHADTLTAWIRIEPLYLGIWTVFVNFVGLLESFNNGTPVAMLFAIAIVYACLYVYIVFRESKKAKTSPNPKSTGRKALVWYTPFVTLFLMLFFLFAIEAEGSEPLVLLEEQELILEFVITILIVAMLFFVMAWIVQQVKSLWKLKNEKSRTEIAHLQSQVSPHFFFNMLNNLYGLVEEDAKKAQELILKLSDVMRYSIYEGQKKNITIKEEVDFLENYIELHKLRYHQKLDIQLITSLKNPEARLIPLLFILLLENAFKHGVEHLREEAYIHMDIQSSANEIHCYIKNNFDSAYLNETTGIGLKNLKRRLLLAYPKKHKLRIETSNEVHNVHLTLAAL